MKDPRLKPEQTPAEATDREGLLRENRELRAKVNMLQARLSEPEDIVRAIRLGEVDAFVVAETPGERIYSLRSADSLYRAMVEEMKEGAVSLDSSGIIVYCNSHFAGLMKSDRATMVGASILPFASEQSRDFFQGLAEEGSGGAPRRREITLRAKDGSLIPVFATLNRLHADEGQIFCVILTDLTDEKRRDQLVAESQRKDEFLAMLAHELRNPIAPIRNAAQILGTKGLDPQRLRWATNVIDRQVAQLTRLVDDLLDVSRITRGKIRLELEPTDVNAVVADALETVRPIIEARKQELAVNLPAQPPLFVRADKTRLSQVLSNLLHNAAKFTPERGRISLEVASRESWVHLTVRDTGVGIAPEVLPKIFDLFTQADPSHGHPQGGLGIGLTLVRALVEMQGGTVEGVSEGHGHGSEFIVRLPALLTGERPATNLPGPRLEPSRSSGRKFLIVDDNVDAAESLMVLLEEFGHDARIAHNGETALEDAINFRPDVIIMDLGLPGMSGHAAARQLRRMPELDGTILIALTGYGRDEDRRLSREAGFDQHWVKPIDPDALDQLMAGLTPPG